VAVAAIAAFSMHKRVPLLTPAVCGLVLKLACVRREPLQGPARCGAHWL
jgi:hypothetical protein